ncbi:erythromycin esterase family protein [Plantactinospora sp. GCM10030261]|uniref:erythromycin esterase family protein n=1 Tax=Plantactinospora sp. GCM10030261 TaxID=3273420 RepID=UPI0036175E0B
MNDQSTDIQRVGHTISALVKDATIVGLGTGSRAGHELFRLVEHTTHNLIESGFRVIAVLDNQRVGEKLDRFVQGADVDLDAALGQAWGPWRTAEMRDALSWLRRRNERHPGDPVRFVAIGAPGVLPGDYDRVVDLLTRVDGPTTTRVRELLDLVRVAHDSGEHVLRAQGTHPGVPFVELARTARDLTARLAAGAERDEALSLLDAMVEHHANAIGAGYDAAREERAAAGRLLDLQRRTGDRVVLWEGSAHVAAHQSVMMGSHLRTALSDGYAAVHLTFGRGRIPGLDLPDPSPDSLEAVLLAGDGEPIHVVDLRSGVPADLAAHVDRPSRTRLISGMYDPEHDEEHYYELPSPRASFDVAAVLPTISPVHPLPASD